MSANSHSVALRHLAHTRSGDKGNTSNVVVVAWNSDVYPFIREQLTEAAFAAHYEGVVKGPVTRYAVDHLGVLNFVAEGALGGGVSRSLSLDQYGKTLAAAVLNFEVQIPDALVHKLVNYPMEDDE